MKKGVMGFFILHAVIGAYFVNFSMHFVKIPEVISKFDSWIIFVGGLLILLGAFNYYRAKRVLNPVLR